MWDADKADQVIKEKDHVMDAFRYLCIGLKQAGLATVHGSFYEQPSSPGRMSQLAHKDPALYNPEDNPGRGLHLGSRSGQRSRLSGLPRHTPRRY